MLRAEADGPAFAVPAVVSRWSWKGRPEVFDAFDRDGDGKLSRAELLEAIGGNVLEASLCDAPASSERAHYGGNVEKVVEDICQKLCDMGGGQMPAWVTGVAPLAQTGADGKLSATIRVGFAPGTTPPNFPGRWKGLRVVLIEREPTEDLGDTASPWVSLGVLGFIAYLLYRAYDPVGKAAETFRVAVARGLTDAQITEGGPKVIALLGGNVGIERVLSALEGTLKPEALTPTQRTAYEYLSGVTLGGEPGKVIRSTFADAGGVAGARKILAALGGAATKDLTPLGERIVRLLRGAAKPGEAGAPPSTASARMQGVSPAARGSEAIAQRPRFSLQQPDAVTVAPQRPAIAQPQRPQFSPQQPDAVTVAPQRPSAVAQPQRPQFSPQQPNGITVAPQRPSAIAQPQRPQFSPQQPDGITVAPQRPSAIAQPQRARFSPQQPGAITVAPQRPSAVAQPQRARFSPQQPGRVPGRPPVARFVGSFVGGLRHEVPHERTLIESMRREPHRYRGDALLYRRNPRRYHELMARGRLPSQVWERFQGHPRFRYLIEGWEPERVNRFFTLFLRDPERALRMYVRWRRQHEAAAAARRRAQVQDLRRRWTLGRGSSNFASSFNRVAAFYTAQQREVLRRALEAQSDAEFEARFLDIEAQIAAQREADAKSALQAVSTESQMLQGDSYRDLDQPMDAPDANPIVAFLQDANPTAPVDEIKEWLAMLAQNGIFLAVPGAMPPAGASVLTEEEVMDLAEWPYESEGALAFTLEADAGLELWPLPDANGRARNREQLRGLVQGTWLERLLPEKEPPLIPVPSPAGQKPTVLAAETGQPDAADSDAEDTDAGRGGGRGGRGRGRGWGGRGSGRRSSSGGWGPGWGWSSGYGPWWWYYNEPPVYVVDDDESGTPDAPAMAAYQGPVLPWQGSMEAFRALDANGDGIVEQRDLESGLGRTGAMLARFNLPAHAEPPTGAAYKWISGVRCIVFPTREAKARYMADAAVHDTRDPQVLSWANQFIRIADPLARAQAILRFAQLGIRYEHDPAWFDAKKQRHGIELLDSSAVGFNRGYGDCDLKARIFVALALVTGLQARIDPVFVGENGFPHVRACVRIGEKGWLVADPTIVNSDVGRLPMRAKVAASSDDDVGLAPGQPTKPDDEARVPDDEAGAPASDALGPFKPHVRIFIGNAWYQTDAHGRATGKNMLSPQPPPPPAARRAALLAAARRPPKARPRESAPPVSMTGHKVGAVVETVGKVLSTGVQVVKTVADIGSAIASAF